MYVINLVAVLVNLPLDKTLDARLLVSLLCTYCVFESNVGQTNWKTANSKKLIVLMQYFMESTVSNIIVMNMS